MAKNDITDLKWTKNDIIDLKWAKNDPKNDINDLNEPKIAQKLIGP